MPFKEIFTRTSYRDPNLFPCSQAGMVNNLNDGMAWGLFPLFFATANLSLERIAVLAATYPAVWGVGQLFTGALLSGIIADLLGVVWAIAAVGALTFASGLVVALRMTETLKRE